MITFKFQVSFSPTLCSHLTDELSAEMRRAPTGPAPRGSARVPSPVCPRRRLATRPAPLPSRLGTAADDSYFDVQGSGSVALRSVPGGAGNRGRRAHEARGPSRKPRRGALVHSLQARGGGWARFRVGLKPITCAGRGSFYRGCRVLLCSAFLLLWR